MRSPRPIGDKRDPQDLRPRFQRPGVTGLMGGFRAAPFAVRTAGVAVLLLHPRGRARTTLLDEDSFATRWNRG